MKSIYKMLLGLVACSSMLMVACDDDDNSPSTNSNPITIKAIYLQDATSNVPDRLLEEPYKFVRQGQMLRIEGSGFAGINRIYINGYSCYFNNAIMTDNNVWVQVSGKVPIVDALPEERNTIVLSKASGVRATYAISVRAAAPSITSFANSLPMAGETVVARGSGLLEVSKVTLPSGTVLTDNIECDEDGEWFSFVMPEGETQGGSLFIECANGGAYSPAYFNYSKGMILNFDGIGVQGGWSWSETGSMLQPAEGKDKQYTDPLGTGRGNVQCMTPERLLPMKAKERLAEMWTAGGEKGAWSDPSEDWSRLIDEGVIETTTSISDLAIQFDIYVENGLKTGYFTLMLTNNFSSLGNRPYSGLYTPVIDNGGEPLETDGWTTVTLPLNTFTSLTPDDGDLTFEDILALRSAASYANFGLIMHNADITIDEVAYPTSLDVEAPTAVYVDNFRLVSTVTPAFNEFGDEETEVE